MELSARAREVQGSVTLAMDARAKQMRAEGKDVIGFGAGEPDFDTPAHIKRAAVEALEQGKTRYTPASGTLELKKAVCDKLLRDNGLTYQPGQIIISNGAKHSLFNALQAILNPGDEVVIPEPYWVTYPELVKMADGVPVYVKTEELAGFLMSPESFEKACTPRTKAMILNSPSNPSGCVYDWETLKKIAEIALKHEIFVISDEIYESLIYDGEKHFSIAAYSKEMQEMTVTVNGMSKAYAMTGWRIGYTASNSQIAKLMSNYQSHSTSNPNSIAQYAALEALNGPQDEIEKMVRAFDERRVHLVERINAINGLSCIMPKGAFYAFVNISGAIGRHSDGKLIDGSMTFCDALLDAQDVLVVPGAAFGMDAYIRMSYAISMEHIDKGLDRIKAFMESLNI